MTGIVDFFTASRPLGHHFASFGSQGDDEVLRVGRAGISDAVFLIYRD
jgi:hypothetical protein